MSFGQAPEDKALVVTLSITIITTILVIVITFYVNYLSCISKTDRMGFLSEWSLLGGCQIEVQDGQWIPLENYYFKQE